MAFLRIIAGSQKGQKFEIDRDKVVIGRAPENVVAVDDAAMSGQHCAVLREGRKYTLKDLDSTNGTRLNNDKFDRIITWIDSDTPPTDRADLIDDGDYYAGFSPTTVCPGSTSFHVWSDVRNVGTASSGGFSVAYYASTNTTITTSDRLIGTDYVSSISPFRRSFWFSRSRTDALACWSRDAISDSCALSSSLFPASLVRASSSLFT